MFKKLFLLLLTTTTFAFAKAQYTPFVDDSTEVKQADSLITLIVQQKLPTTQDKVQYLSRLTRYGFKNLFQKTTYNSAMSYSSQVDPHAETFMQDYLKAHSKSLLQMKSWGTPYFNLIDNIFAQYGLPKELKYLAVIESNLSAAATSWVGACGPWQFMPYTARDYGLVVTPGFDERRDYYKSTHAAARYLLSLYKDMHDWLLVIAAYNGGPGRVYSAIRQSGSRNFWALQYYLPTESRNHVKKFIATHYIMEGLTSASMAGAPVDKSAMFAGYGLQTGTLTEDELKSTLQYEVTGKFNSVIIVKNIVMDITAFNRYNPNFDGVLLSEGKYQLALPADKMQQFMSMKYQILNECVQVMLANDEAPQNNTVYPKKYQRKAH